MPVQTCTSAASTGPGLTADKLLASIREMQQMLAPIPRPPKIVESLYAVTRERVKRYPKRKAKSAAHHRRMDKKWLKRYGHSNKPAAFLMDDRVTPWMMGSVLVIHPSLAARMRAGLSVQSAAAPGGDNA